MFIERCRQGHNGILVEIVPPGAKWGYGGKKREAIF